MMFFIQTEHCLCLVEQVSQRTLILLKTTAWQRTQLFLAESKANLEQVEHNIILWHNIYGCLLPFHSQSEEEKGI